jgi:hypothetical protein
MLGGRDVNVYLTSAFGRMVILYSSFGGLILSTMFFHLCPCLGLVSTNIDPYQPEEVERWLRSTEQSYSAPGSDSFRYPPKEL